MIRVVLLGDSAEPGLARLAELLSSAGVELDRAETPGTVDYVAEAGRAHAVLFAAELLPKARLERLRGRNRATRWIAWTPGYSSSRSAELLAAGADEVVTGAMGDDEVVARVLGAAGRRHSRGEALQAGELMVDLETGETSWAGREIELTRREREVLAALASSPGKTVPREVLYRDVWGFAMARGDRTVDVNVKRVRDKLAAAGADVVIRTRPGVGYRLELVESPAESVVTKL